jgi:DNA replication and repair protein RecF
VIINSLQLQNFRNYPKKGFEFTSGTTLLVGPNASGKTNLLEAIYLLATGKSFRAGVDD